MALKRCSVSGEYLFRISFGIRIEILQVLRILNRGLPKIKDSNSSLYPFQREMLMEAKIPETPIEVGDIAINATVNVVFYIE